MTSYVDDKTKMNAVIMGRKTWEGNVYIFIISTKLLLSFRYTYKK